MSELKTLDEYFIFIENSIANESLLLNNKSMKESFQNIIQKFMDDNDTVSFIKFLDFTNNNWDVIYNFVFEQAISCDNFKFVEIYIDYTRLQNSTKYLDIIALCICDLIKQGQIEKMKRILEYYPEFIYCVDSNKFNILHIMCAISDFDQYVYYVDLYPELMTNKHQFYPIEMCKITTMYSIYDWNLDYYKKIIVHFLDNYFKYDIPNSNIFIAEFLSQFITEHGPDEDLCKKTINILYNDPNSLLDFLYYSMGVLPENCVKMIFECDIDIEANNELLINMLTEYGRYDLYDIFREIGVKPNYHFLIKCCKENEFDIVKRILQDDDIDISGRVNNQTILQTLLISSANTEIFLYILNQPNIDIHDVDSCNNTLLHYLYNYDTHQHDTTIVRTLLERGVNPYTLDIYNSCFFHYATSYEYVMILKEFNIDVNIHDKSKYPMFVHFLFREKIVNLPFEKYKEVFDFVIDKNPHNDDSFNVIFDAAIRVNLRSNDPNKPIIKIIEKIKIIQEELNFELSHEVKKLLHKFDS